MPCRQPTLQVIYQLYNFLEEKAVEATRQKEEFREKPKRSSTNHAGAKDP
jgi:hypothetical protein